MKSIIEKANKLAIKEIEKYGAPSIWNFRITNRQGQILAEKYKADKNIVLLGTLLIDLKLGQALKENTIKQHIKMSTDTARKFLEKEKVSKETLEKVIHCIEAHHGNIPYQSREAEIVANADCYRFLTLRGSLMFLVDLVKKERESFDNALNYIEEKADEKWKIVSLPEVKKELKPNYKLIKELVHKAKTSSVEIIKPEETSKGYRKKLLSLKTEWFGEIEIKEMQQNRREIEERLSKNKI